MTSHELVREAEHLADWIRQAGLGGAADQVVALVREVVEDSDITNSILLELLAGE